MSSFDYFVGNLKCPKCGEVSPADETTGMQTKIQRYSDMRNLGIGDEVKLDSDVESSGYRCYMEHRGNSLKLIEAWECPSCDKPYNCALITIEDSKIVDIVEVELTEHVIRSVNYIFEECSLMGWHVSRGIVEFSDV
ncbi:hypothetical protein [Hahella chejuensis]|uniref:hypothetical protein n=1 Tax=Hahella chejuensis TaxID=158327 RepID=UPI0005A18BA4|nr:hypothetical protein [Hahella chejuensis]